MPKQTVYISGKITGNPNYKADFEKAEKMLTEKGFNAINPCKIGEYDFFTYEQFLHIDFALIDIADAILMLPNWESSKGANRELQYARSRGKSVILKDELIESELPKKANIFSGFPQTIYFSAQKHNFSIDKLFI